MISFTEIVSRSGVPWGALVYYEGQSANCKEGGASPATTLRSESYLLHVAVFEKSTA